MGRAVLVPSEAYRKWFREAMKQVPVIKRMLIDAGLPIPLLNKVSVKALFYREANVGDATGFYEGLADFLQSPKLGKNGKTVRQGAGIIADDSQIRDWDGSRLLKDADNPRIECEITVLGQPVGSQQELALAGPAEDKW